MSPDYSGQNLRGRSFKGQNLEGANFSGADIRGADFTNAKLMVANFSHVKAGLQRCWAIGLLIFSLLLSTGLGFTSAVNGILVGTGSFYATLVSLIILAAFFVTTVCLGLITAIGLTAVTGTVAVIVAGSVRLAGAYTVSGDIAAAVAVAGTFTVVCAVAGSVALAVAEVVAGILGAVLVVAVAMIVAMAVTGIGGAVSVLTGSVTGIGLEGVAVAVVVAVAVTVISAYIGWRALTEDQKQAFLRNIAISIAACGGTSFRGADLTNTDFTKATLKSTDFRKAILTRTCFHQVKMLDRVRPGRSYLENAEVRQLLVTGQGQNKNFDRQDFRGINLHGANLENASFIDADFYQAKLCNANLSRAILVRSNFERADLRGANLTGCCIQDWVITESTKLDEITCDRVYLKWIDGDKRDQMPPRGQFTEGGFVTFVRYILETVELYHEKDINPRLALTVLQKMSRDYDEPFDIVALGKRGEKVFIQVKVSENILRENFKEDYYSRYDTDLKLWSGNIHQLPPSINSFIEKRIHEIVSERMDDFVFVNANYIEGNYAEIYQGEVSMSGDRTINMGDGNYNERIKGNYVQGNYYAAQTRSLAEAAAQIQQLLQQLQETNPTTTETERAIVAAKAAEEIKNNPLLKARVIGALKSGGKEAFKEAVDNPIINVLVAIIEGWQKI